MISVSLSPMPADFPPPTQAEARLAAVHARYPLRGFPSSSAVLEPEPLRTGRGNCVECRGTGEARGVRSVGVLFCDACGGSGDYTGPPRRVIGPDDVGVTLYGPVPAWLAECLRDATPVPSPLT